MKKDQYLKIHERLVLGDPIAPSELAEIAWKPLLSALKKRFPNLAQTDYPLDAASDALLSYIKNPAQYDPTKRGLFGFLLMAAQGDLLNALEKNKRRNLRETSMDNVALCDIQGNEDIEIMEEDLAKDAKHLEIKIRKLFKDARDREAVSLLLDGERSTQVFAKVWSIDQLPINDQATIVKRHKDRIKKVLKRHGGDFHGK
jgi:RNA polymerase sigma-70 factor (ECF subfamily)